MNRIAKEYINIFKYIRKDAWYYLAGNFFAGFGFTGFNLLFNLFLKSSGTGESLIGNILSIGTYATVLMIFPAAFLVKRIRIKPILIFIPVLTAAGYSIAISAKDIKAVMLGIAIAGFTNAFSSVISGPLIMQSSGKKERMHLFSLNHVTMLLSGVTGSLVAGFLPQILYNMGIEYTTGYKIAIFIHLILAVVSITFYSRIRVNSLGSGENSGIFRLKLKTSKKTLFFLALPPMIVGLGAGMTIPFLNLYFRTQFNMQPGSIGVLFASAQLFTIAGSLSAPILGRRFGKIMSVILSQVLSIPFLFILGISSYLPLSILAFLVRNALMNMSGPLTTNLSMELVHPDDRSITSGLMSVAWLATWGLTANIGGFLIERTGGYMLPFTFTMIFYLISSLCYYFFLLPIEKTHELALKESGTDTLD